MGSRWTIAEPPAIRTVVTSASGRSSAPLSSSSSALQLGIASRLVNDTALQCSDDMLDDSGLVDPAKVTSGINALIEAKPYLRKAAPSIAQGVMPQAPAEVGLFDLIRQRI